MECMAASDNVVRAGFTPKFKDVDTLIGMLTYSYAPIEEQKLEPTPYRGLGNSVVYDPPIGEFSVLKTVLADGAAETVPGIDGPSILIGTKGTGKISVGSNTQPVEEGYIFFVGAGEEVVLKAGEGVKEFIVFRAFCEVA